MTNDITWIHGGILGYVKSGVRKDEKTGEEEDVIEPGVGLAMRKNGDEILFGGAGEDEKPCRWIPIGDFYLDPSLVPEPDAGEGEGGEETETGETTPPQTTPFGRRR